MLSVAVRDAEKCERKLLLELEAKSHGDFLSPSLGFPIWETLQTADLADLGLALRCTGLRSQLTWLFPGSPVLTPFRAVFQHLQFKLFEHEVLPVTSLRRTPWLEGCHHYCWVVWVLCTSFLVTPGTSCLATRLTETVWNEGCDYNVLSLVGG